MTGIYFYNEDSELCCLVLSDFKKLDTWKAKYCGFIEQDLLTRDTGETIPYNELKIVDGVVCEKDEDDYTKERIDIAEATISECNTLCMAYQTGETDPRIDPNFYSTIIVVYGMKKDNGTKTAEDCPCCQAVTDWINMLWITVWSDIKTKIRAGETYSTDFATLMVEAGSTANPPYSFDECYVELI